MNYFVYLTNHDQRNKLCHIFIPLGKCNIKLNFLYFV